MQSIVVWLVIAGWWAVAVAGLLLEDPVLAPYGVIALAFGLAMLGARGLRLLYRPEDAPWPAGTGEPGRLQLSWRDHAKALVCWFDAFRRTFAVAPGLYYTGDRYDLTAPLLVTSNYHLSLFLLLRALAQRTVRILVVDTGGINVWCAGGKGAFDNAAILAQLERYDRAQIAKQRFVTLILPKFATAGIDIRALRKEATARVVIGPLYARDVPAYLDAGGKLTDCDEDVVVYGLRMRLFTWLPGLVQTIGYAMAAGLAFVAAEWAWGVAAPLGALVGITACVATAYPLLFPWLPGERFAVKGISLAGLMTLAWLALFAGGVWTAEASLVATVFTFATAIFFGLSYTGNSAVSNYSKVRREIARFLPLDVALFAASLALFLVLGG